MAIRGTIYFDGFMWRVPCWFLFGAKADCGSMFSDSSGHRGVARICVVRACSYQRLGREDVRVARGLLVLFCRRACASGFQLCKSAFNTWINGERRRTEMFGCESTAVGVIVACGYYDRIVCVPGQDVQVVMNFFLTKLRDSMTDPLLSSCPALLRVSMNF